ncbi:DUF2786 domain-containing protein [Nonomuraea sp. NPDC059194]|uniref:DUF2786 domain-containing protein n=1 Tax=Nonomuraea sp. NPDC059194 TaxID=3346764 RepID=UPI003695BAFB
MGKANRAKRKERPQPQHRDERHREDVPQEEKAATPAELIAAAVELLRHDEQAGFDQCAARLAEQEGDAPGWARTVDRELIGMLTRLLATLWRNGWQPADVVRLVGRRRDKSHAAMVTELIALELRVYAPATLLERWTPYLEATTGDPLATPREPRLLTLTRALELLQTLTAFPRLERLGPIPGQARRAPTAPRPTADGKTLTRVRALLAKAESTPFEAEAETFTAAAQRLMAKHSIDRALLDAHADADLDRPAGVRIGVDAPYEQAKATLLSVVADANRCRAIWSEDLGFSTVLGFEADLDAVELLFTSLLVQANTAIVQAGTKKHGSGRSRPRSFRESFLQSFTARIGERLDAAATETVQAEAAARGTDLIPVLAARTAEVDQAVEAMFPELTHSRMRGAYDSEGWAAGRAAADQARLAVRDQVGS